MTVTALRILMRARWKENLIRTLLDLRGNVRGCVYTEALWGIPYNLYIPYVSVYMLAFGLTDAQIGLLTTIGLALQVFWALMSGAITDKFGRKRTTLVVDLVSWSVPCLIWAASQNFYYFLVAAIFNSVWRVSANSWQCLLVEDTDPRLLVDVYSWIYIAGLVVAFITPFGGMLIGRFSLVPTMRALYLLSFVMMTAKFLIMNVMVTETGTGVVRMQETQSQHLFAILGGSQLVLKQILRMPIVLLATGLMLVVSISNMIRGIFWSILVVEKLGIPAERLALYFTARSVMMLLVFFLVMPKLRRMNVGKPMFFGFVGLLLSQAVLVATPTGGYVVLLISTLLEALSFPAASALVDKLMVIVVDARERARIMALLYTVVLVFTSPFGWIAGQLSGIDRTLPFVLNIVLYCIGGLLAFWMSRLVRGEDEQGIEDQPMLEGGAAA